MQRDAKNRLIGDLLTTTDAPSFQNFPADPALPDVRFHIFDQAAVGMVIASQSGQFLRVNQRFADIIGYTKEEIVGQLCAQATHADDRGHEAVSIAKLIGEEIDGDTWEKRYLRKDGSAVWCTLSLSLLSLEEDNCWQFLGVVQDISERKRSQETLEHSQALLRIAGNMAKLGGWMIDLPSQVLHWSDEVRAIHEAPPDFEPTLEKAIEYYPAQYRDQIVEQFTRCAKDGTSFDFEHELITLTGRRIWVQANGEAMRDQYGVIVRLQGALQDITARKESEASLAESQRRFRSMAGTFPFIVWTAQPDGRTDYINRVFDASTGGDQNSSSYVNWTPYLHPDDLPRCRNAWRTAVSTGHVYLEDYRLRETSGANYRWFRVRAEPVCDATGQIIKWYGTSMDITETKLLEQEARSLANRLNNTLESITDGFFIVDKDWTFKFINGQAARLLGRTREDLLDKDIRSEFPQLVGSGLEKKCLAAAKSGVPTYLKEHLLLSPDHWYDISVYPSEEGVAVYFRDVTQNRADLAQLRLLETAVSRLNDVVLITEAEPFDEPGPRILFVNEAFEKRTGYTQAEVIGKTPRILQGPKTQKAELERIRMAMNAWQPVRSELINYTKSGEEFWLELEIVPIADSKGWFTHWVAIERDITERKLAQQEILELNNDLEERVRQRTHQLEKVNKELGSFSYSISHDLRSPLSTIHGFGQLLLKSDGDRLSEKGKHYLSRICAGAINMGKLTDGLLALVQTSRVNLRREEVNLSMISSNVVKQLRDAEPDRVVDVRIQPDLMVNGDPTMLAVVMHNLIGNAWKYSSKTPHARLEIGSETADEGVPCIFVRDNGTGFEMTEMERLFEPFTRLHQDTDFKGTGIGLANVKGMVGRHGGRVWAESLPGEGAIFRFTLQAASL